jgi:hypothetical protein
MMTPDGIFVCRVQRQSQCPLSTKHPEFALSVAVVDTHRVLRSVVITGRRGFPTFQRRKTQIIHQKYENQPCTFSINLFCFLEPWRGT